MIQYYIIQDNNFPHFYRLKVHYVTFVLFQYRSESAYTARLGCINKKRYCKDIVPTGILNTE